ncbi:hypothetical protein LS48_02380 [Aequorivita aquimaris]|uniref:Uncharacterized protein n=1 Tax=Aequorivita aquimaris TaxID=1548749 RepID=A0A137RM96_9FLAO|nr:hypothetical protein [Aequorivita aquimaris]KXO01326.1 hypothetical protein LS48_02380 [Aequorivita aquimaris]|tara:strand:- start:364 stop:861 length:498 start_codon:yes stop_codon:yes gene_type:complete
MEKNTSPITPKSFLRTFTLIHLVLVASVLIFGLMMFLQTKNQELIFTYSGDVMFFVVPFMAIAGIVAGNYLYGNIIKGLASKNTLMEKLNGFQSASVVKYALLEGPALLGIVAFMNEGNQYFLIISLLLLGWLIMQRPTRDRVERDLMLQGPLKSEFQQEDKPLE